MSLKKKSKKSAKKAAKKAIKKSAKKVAKKKPAKTIVKKAVKKKSAPKPVKKVSGKRPTAKVVEAPVKMKKVIPLFKGVVRKKEAPAPVAKGPLNVKTNLTKKELNIYRDILLDLRSKIAGDLKHLEDDSLKKSTEEMTGDHADIIDTAQDEFDREFVLSLAANEQKILNKIDVALHKISDGTYGMCEKYGTPIPKKRLMALPYTTMSIRAQEEQEKGI